MYYCFKCDLAGDISYDWCGKVACFNCGSELEEKSYEWIKSQSTTKVIETRCENVEGNYP
jgi:hypothetical protein